VILAKWGGSLLTNKAGRGPPRFQSRAARRLAREWARALADRPGLLVHGAGSFGHPQVQRWRVGQRRLRGEALRSAILEVGANVHALQTDVVNALRDAGLPAVAVPASFLARAQGGRVRLRPAPLLELVDHGFHPVTGGDLILDDAWGARVLGGDELLTLLARIVRPTRAVYATDVDGVRLDGRLLLELPPAAARSAARRIERGTDATGGMRGKLEAAIRLQRLGVDTWIVNGQRPGRLARAVAGKPGAGTRLPPARHI